MSPPPRLRRADSCGFEHVFVGETRHGREIMGFHNWVQFYLQEKCGHVDYKGYKARDRKSTVSAPERRPFWVRLSQNLHVSTRVLISGLIFNRDCTGRLTNQLCLCLVGCQSDASLGLGVHYRADVPSPSSSSQNKCSKCNKCRAACSVAVKLLVA